MAWSGMTLERINTIALYVLIAALFVGLGVSFHKFLDVGFWRHDSMYYEPSYLHKLSEEGRWLNYLLSPVLRLIPPVPAIAFVFLGLFGFCYIAMYRLTESRSYSTLVALLVLHIPFLYLQVLWPVTTVPSLVILVLAAATARKIPSYVFFPIFSVLFFATLSHFYFLLPLLFLRDLDFRKFCKLLGLWMIAFPVGFLVAQLITRVITGDFIEVAPWRNTNPIESLADLSTNAGLAWASLVTVTAKLVKFTGPAVAVLTLLVASLDRDLRRDYPALLTMLCSALAVYVTSIPYGLGVAYRTALVFAICLLFIVFAKPSLSAYGRSLTLIYAVFLGIGLQGASHKNMTWFASVTGTIRTELERALPRSIDPDAEIYIAMSKPTVAAVMRKIEYCEGVEHIVGEGIATPYRISPALKELGLNNVFLCGECPDVPKVNLDDDNCESRVFKYRRSNRGEYLVFPSEHYLK